MPSVSFKLKILTPMFMGGANPDGQPELRAASIRGAMRFWFRAIAGAVTDKPQEVYKLESEVFGNTERKSKVVVRVRKDAEKYYELNPWQRISPWVAYLANMGLARPGRGFVRKAIAPDSEFWVDIFETGSAIGIGTSVLKITVYLGGFGARWRHGFGSSEIIEENNSPYTSVNISDLLSDAINKVKRIASNLKILPKEPKNVPSFPTFVNFYYQIWERILNSQDWSQMLAWLGKEYREFRINDGDKNHFGHTWEFLRIVKPIFEGREIESGDPHNDIFGLPIQISKKYGEKRKTAVINVQEKEISRRASPLILHVEPGEDRSIIRATLFISKFIPDDVKYYVDKKPDLPLKKPQESDYSRIVDFLTFLGLTRAYPQNEEVS